MKLTKKKYNIKSRKNKNVKRSREQNRKKTKRVNSIQRIKLKKIKGGVVDDSDETDYDETDNELNENDIDELIRLLTHNKSDDNDIANIKSYIDNEEYKKDGLFSGINSNLASFINNPKFLDYLKEYNIFDKFESIENPKKNVKIVFYSSKGKKNSVRKYPYFKVFIQDGNTMNDIIDQVDTSLANIMSMSSKMTKHKDVYTRTININIEDLLKMAQPENTKEKE
jgi:hypothetical protein